MNLDILMILIFGVIIIGLEILVMIKLQKGWGDNSVKIIGLTLMLIMALVVVFSKVEIEKVTAIIGLLGTIAGYLMGKNDLNK